MDDIASAHKRSRASTIRPPTKSSRVANGKTVSTIPKNETPNPIVHTFTLSFEGLFVAQTPSAANANYSHSLQLPTDWHSAEFKSLGFLHHAIMKKRAYISKLESDLQLFRNSGNTHLLPHSCRVTVNTTRFENHVLTLSHLGQSISFPPNPLPGHPVITDTMVTHIANPVITFALFNLHVSLFAAEIGLHSSLLETKLAEYKEKEQLIKSTLFSTISRLLQAQNVGAKLPYPCHIPFTVDSYRNAFWKDGDRLPDSADELQNETINREKHFSSWLAPHIDAIFNTMASDDILLAELRTIRAVSHPVKPPEPDPVMAVDDVDAQIDAKLDAALERRLKDLGILPNHGSSNRKHGHASTKHQPNKHKPANTSRNKQRSRKQNQRRNSTSSRGSNRSRASSRTQSSRSSHGSRSSQSSRRQRNPRKNRSSTPFNR